MYYSLFLEISFDVQYFQVHFTVSNNLNCLQKLELFSLETQKCFCIWKNKINILETKTLLEKSSKGDTG